MYVTCNHICSYVGIDQDSLNLVVFIIMDADALLSSVWMFASIEMTLRVLPHYASELSGV